MAIGIKSEYGDITYVNYQALTGGDLLELTPQWGNEYVTIYQSGRCEIKTQYVGVRSISYTRFTGETGVVSANANSLVYIGATIYNPDPDAQNHMVVLRIEAPDSMTAATKINNVDWSTDNILFIGSLADANNNGAAMDMKDWDSTPTEDEDDPENELPQGGEYADLGLFEQTDIMSISDIPNPESVMNMDYGGFLRTYVIDQATLTAIGSSLFSPNFWTSLKQKFEGLSNPLSMIVNCIQIPVWNIGGSGGTLRIGGVEVEDEDGETIPVQFTSTRYVRYGMGSVTLKEIWGSEKDYNDVSISVFLPYVGVKEIDPDVVVGCTMTLTCYIDIWTGDILYLMHVSNADAKKKYFTAQSVPYRWSGNCAKTIPIGRVDNTNKLLSMAGVIAGLGVGAATMGAGLAGAAGGMALASQGLAGGAGDMSAGLGIAKIGMGIAGAAAAKGLHSGFNPTVQTSSGVSGASGQMDYQYAYLMVKRGVPKYPNNWRSVIGATNYQTFQGLSMTGYTLFSEIHLTGMADASENERIELERILTEEGVIL